MVAQSIVHRFCRQRAAGLGSIATVKAALGRAASTLLYGGARARAARGALRRRPTAATSCGSSCPREIDVDALFREGLRERGVSLREGHGLPARGRPQHAAPGHPGVTPDEDRRGRHVAWPPRPARRRGELRRPSGLALVVVALGLRGRRCSPRLGFGFSLLAAPLLFAALDPQQAVGLLAALGLLVNAAGRSAPSAAARRRWPRTSARSSWPRRPAPCWASRCCARSTPSPCSSWSARGCWPRWPPGTPRAAGRPPCRARAPALRPRARPGRRRSPACSRAAWGPRPRPRGRPCCCTCSAAARRRRPCATRCRSASSAWACSARSCCSRPARPARCPTRGCSPSAHRPSSRATWRGAAASRRLVARGHYERAVTSLLLAAVLAGLTGVVLGA